MVQTNKTSSAKREVKRVNSNAPAPAAAPAPALQGAAGCSTTASPNGQQWYWQADNGEWCPYDVQDAVNLEQQFTTDTSAIICVSRGQYTYLIDLGEMQQTNMTTGKVRKLRRGQNTSSLRCLGSGSIWFWEDNDGGWIKFVQGPGNDLIQKLEAAFVADPKSKLNIQIGNYSYVIDLEQMTQTNTKTGKVRRIKRAPIPAKRVLNPEIQSGSNTVQTVEIQKPVSHCIYPPTWENCSSRELQKIVISSSSEEFREIARFFNKTAQGLKLKSVTRIQNPDFYDRFYVYKTQFEKRMGQGMGIYRLFHGTNKSNIDNICRQGFDFRLHTVHYYGREVILPPMPVTRRITLTAKPCSWRRYV
jgi:hypothetical protein